MSTFFQRRLLRVQVVAERLDVSPKTVRRKIERGELAAAQLGGPGSSIRIEAELERWLYGMPKEPAVEAAGITKPCRIYDLRSTFTSNALAAGVTVFELARVMGTSVAMIEHHYGALIDGAHAGIVGRLDAIEIALEEAAKEARVGV